MSKFSIPPKNLPKLLKAANDLPPGESRIKVVVRKRPLSKKEIATGRKDILEKKDKMCMIVYEPKQKVDLTPYIENHEFFFDQAFDENTNNEELYSECVRPLVFEAFKTKAKCTCFAYGQTGSGKTHTMMGPSRQNPNDAPTKGLFALAAHDIFKYIDLPEYNNISVFVSFYEIYCGKLHDLLNNRRQLAARDNGQQKVVICGLTEVPIGNENDFLSCINFGLTARTTGVTGANFDSSRSHAILQISLRENSKDAGRISFIDLAGSERGADTIDQDRQTARDGAEINKSLLALKECIRALDLQKDHTPFRGSKLTMVLKESFLGNCRTLMIANLSPSDQSCEHTLNTLRYAYRVRELRRINNENDNTNPIINDTNDVNLSSSSDVEDNDQLTAQLDNNTALSTLLANARAAANNSLLTMNVSGSIANNVNTNNQRKSQRISSAYNRNPLTVSTLNNSNNNSNTVDQIDTKSRPDSPSSNQNNIGRVSKRNPPQSIQHTQGKNDVVSKLNISDTTTATSNTRQPKASQSKVTSTTPNYPVVATSTILDELEIDYKSSDVTLSDLAAAHDKLITKILIEEEELIHFHRTHIDLLVDIMKEELFLLAEVEKSGSDVESYVDGLKKVLQRKEKSLNHVRNKLNVFENFLGAEETLSKKFQEVKDRVNE